MSERDKPNFKHLKGGAILVLATGAISPRYATANTTVQTTNGPVRGTTVASGKVEAFLGIPYAEPPVGRLRFVKPVSKAPWKEVYNANHLPPACIQAKLGPASFPELRRLSEDCLYLNLWVPPSSDSSGLKPIIIFIHGGAFMTGSGSQRLYNGATLAEHGDVIVATINYRLGGLGFFTGFIDDAPGNMGMHDQVAAIRWIKENAESFQGDPNNIVLMGESAGSISVSAHMISPLSKSLFKRAVLLSGSVLHPTYSDNNKKLSEMCQKYANAVGCTRNGETLGNNAEDIVDCLRNLPAEKFSEVDSKILVNLEKIPRDLYSQTLFLRIGDDFLPENTVDSFRKGNFNNTDIYIGVTRNEGSSLLTAFTPALFGVLGRKDVTPYFNETSTRQFIRNSTSSGNESEDDQMIKTYMDRVKVEDKYAYVKALRDAFGDYIISCGAVFQADIQSLRNNSIYFYMFDFLSPLSIFAKWMGVPHGADLLYVFGNPFLRVFSKMEKEFSRHLMDRLVAFAKTGNPNVPKGVTWPRYTFEDPKYLVIGKQDTVGTKPGQNRCEIWRKRFGSVIDDDLIRSLKNTKS